MNNLPFGVHWTTSKRMLDISGDCSLCDLGNEILTVRVINGIIKNKLATKRESLQARFKGKKPPGRVNKQVRRLSKHKHKPVIISLPSKSIGTTYRQK